MHGDGDLHVGGTPVAPGSSPTRDMFRHLVENSPFGIYVVDSDFRLAQVSAGARQVFAGVRPLIGRDFAEVLRHIWTEPFASETIARFRHTLQTGESYRSQRTVERRNDIEETESYDWKIERLVLPDGRPGVVCHFYDLSERLRSEAELRKSEARFQNAFENAAVGMAYSGLDARWLEVNQRFCDLVGYTRDELLALTAYDITRPEDVDASRSHVEAALSGGAETFLMEKRYVRKDGDFVWMGATVALLRDEAGKPSHFISVFRDISDRKSAEGQRDLMIRELAHRIKNQLSVIRSMAAQTARNSSGLDDFGMRFDERLLGFGVATDLLVKEDWCSVSLAELVEQQLKPFVPHPSRLAANGSDLRLTADAAQALGLSLHELATNCVKYGAWSNASGLVGVAWARETGARGMPVLRLSWIESGGPPVTPPTRKGFGSFVIERMVAHKLTGEVETLFAPQGLRWLVVLPAMSLASRFGA